MDRLISEKSVMEVIYGCDWFIDEEHTEVIKERIKAIPSAEPNEGHWIIIDDCEKFIAKCSKCGRIEDSRMISKYPYCHCGAKMVEEQEGAIRNENV